MIRPVCVVLAALLFAAGSVARADAPAIAVYPPLTFEASTSVDLSSRIVARLGAATGGRVQALIFPSGLAPDALTHDLAVNAKSNGFDRFLVMTERQKGADVAVDLALYDTASEKRVGAMSSTASAISADAPLDLSALVPQTAPVAAVVAPPAPTEHAIATVTVPAPGAPPIVTDPGAAAAPADPAHPGGLRGFVARMHPSDRKTMHVILLPFEGNGTDPMSVHATTALVQELDALDVGVKVVKNVDASPSVDDAICQTSQSDAIVTGTHKSAAGGGTALNVELHPCSATKELSAPQAQALRQRFEDNVARNPSTDPVVNAVRRLIRGMLANQG